MRYFAYNAGALFPIWCRNGLDLQNCKGYEDWIIVCNHDFQSRQIRQTCRLGYRQAEENVGPSNDTRLRIESNGSSIVTERSLQLCVNGFETDLSTRDHTRWKP